MTQPTPGPNTLTPATSEPRTRDLARACPLDLLLTRPQPRGWRRDQLRGRLRDRPRGWWRRGRGGGHPGE